MRGLAYVRLDPAFASTIDPRAGYTVFVTPEGETNGLYVGKSVDGFVVRETHGGRSSVAFGYRIVAKPYDTKAARLPAYREPRDVSFSK